MKEVIHYIYGQNKQTGQANNMTEEGIAEETWKKAWIKADEGETRTPAEELYGRAMELAVKIGSEVPMWTGIIYKQWIWILRWVGVPEQKMMEVSLST